MTGGPLDETRLAAARLVAADTQPFLAVALYALTPVAAPGLGTFAVDERWRVFIDPEQLASWSVPEVAGVLLHEVGHLVRDHAGRARVVGVDATTARRWNVAADAEINDDLVLDGVTLPDDGVYPERLGLPSGRAAEWYFQHLLERPDDELPDPHCGPGCHGHDDGAAGATHVSALTSGIDDGEAVLLRRRVADAVLAAPRGPHAGGPSESWTRWAEALVAPSLDWRVVLRGAVRGAVASVRGTTDFTYARPARRRMPHVVLPAMHRPLPVVAIVIDTSGSVDDEMLSAAWSEVGTCLRALGVRRDLLTAYAVDTAVHRIPVTSAPRVALGGGGGTDLRVGIDAAMRVRRRPDVIVVLTDGFTPWPDRPPGPRVVVACMESSFAADGRPAPALPPWAVAVRIPRDRLRANG